MASTAQKRPKQKLPSPLVASVLSQREFDKLLIKANMTKALAEEQRISEQAWQDWALEDLSVDLKLMHLEELLEVALDSEEVKTAEQELPVIPVRIDAAGNLESLPTDVRRLIRSLERLVEQVERDMAKRANDQDES